MRCQQCDYSLWGLRPGPCPECGAPFKPSEHQLPPGGVRFCCPGCHTAYYGTSISGHLIPTAFTCVDCGREVEMDEMTLEPVDSSQTDSMKRLIFLDDTTNRWDHGYFELVGLSLGNPQRLMKRMPKQSPLVRAVATLLITLGLVAIFNVLLIVVFGIGIELIMSSFTNQSGFNSGRGLAVLDTIEDVSIFTLKALAVVLLVFFIWVGLVHGLLRIMGGGQEGFRRTFQAVFYTSTVFILAAVPCVGMVSWIWWLISSIIALAAAHRGQAGRAVVATLLTAAILFFGIQGTVIGIVMLQSPARSPQAMVYSDSQDAGVRLYELTRTTGQVPRHILATDPSFAMACIQPGGDLLPGISEKDYWSLSGEARVQFGSDCVAVMPDDAIAYRVGDVVVTSCQFDPSFFQSGHGGKGDLWIVVGDPLDPMAMNPNSDSNGVFLHGIRSSGGHSLSSRSNGVPTPSSQELNEQNVLRASLNLEPLPPPSTIPLGGVMTPSGLVVPDWPALPTQE